MLDFSSPTFQTSFSFFYPSNGTSQRILEKGEVSFSPQIMRVYFAFLFLFTSEQSRGFVLLELCNSGFLNNLYGVYVPSKNRVVVQVRQDTWAGGFGSLESTLGLLKSLNIRPLIPPMLLLCYRHNRAEERVTVKVFLIPSPLFSV